MVPVVIRKAERSDISMLGHIAYDAWESGILPFLDAPTRSRDAEKARLMAVAAETVERIIVAEHEGLPVGWCSRARARAYIPYLFVAPELQGHGIGSLLLQRMEHLLELAGAQSVTLETPADNVRTVRFYERHGYRILAVRTEGAGHREALTSVHLEKRLRPFEGEI